MAFGTEKHFNLSKLARSAYSLEVESPTKGSNLCTVMPQNRDEFPLHVRRALAERAGFRCSFQPCGALTIGPSEESAESSSSVGIACHITAAAPGGRRYDASKTPEERCSIENGIWMCATHAKLIDTDEVTFPVNLLMKWRMEAEAVAKSRIGVPVDIVEELAGRGYLQKTTTASWEMELNRLVAHRLRDAVSALRFPVVIFVSRHASDTDRSRLHGILNSSQGAVPTDEETSALLDVLCRPELRLKTTGPLTPPNVRWFDWIFQGAVECVQMCDKSLATYAGRADAELVVATEELYRRTNSVGAILRDLDARQEGKLFGDVGRSYFRLLLNQMLQSEAIWINYLRQNYKK